MIKRFFFDTSAILNGALEHYISQNKYGPDNECYVSATTLSELENIKASAHKSEEIKAQARQAVRFIRWVDGIYSYVANQDKVNKLLNKYPFLQDINDHKIICEALLLRKTFPLNDKKLTFVTSDGCQSLLAAQVNNPRDLLEIKFYEPKNESTAASKEEYCGWKKVTPTDEEFSEVYTHPENNIFNIKTNEFIELYNEGQLKDVLFWDGKIYRNLKYKEVIKDKTLGDSIKPLNLEQKMAFDLLQNEHIPVKLLIGNPGTGKDLLMLKHAIDLLQQGKIKKIIFIRNLVPFKDAPEIGFLQGSLDEKISWGLGPLRSLLGEEGLEMYEENGQIEAVNLGFIRGCSWDDTLIYVSEGQNITGGGYKLLVSRCGKNSQIWINGDVLQTDDKKFEENNGLTRLINSLQGNKLFGMVKLLKTERSAVAELAASIV